MRLSPDAEARVRALLPGFDLSGATYRGEGLVNQVLIGNGRVVRIARHAWGPDDLDQEGRVLDAVRHRLDVDVPDWTREAVDVISYPFLEGEPLQGFLVEQWPEADRRTVAGQIAGVLRTIHGIEDAELGPSVTNRDRSVFTSLLEELREELMSYLQYWQVEYVEDLFAPVVDGTLSFEHTPVLVNGDLSVYHLICDREERRLSSIIDWGTAGIGDPAVDFACLINEYDPAFVSMVCDAYGDVSAVWQRAVFWARTLPLQWALIGLRDPEDPAWRFAHIGR
jgi:aminoglycoside 2''-phosphotransferase